MVSWTAQSIISVLSAIQTSTVTDDKADRCSDGWAWRIHLVYRELLVRKALGQLDGREERHVLELVAEAHGNMRQV